MINRIKSFTIAAHKRNNQVTLTKLDRFAEIYIQESNAFTFIHRNFPDCQDLGRINIGGILWADALLPEKAEETNKECAPQSKILRIRYINELVHFKQVSRGYR